MPFDLKASFTWAKEHPWEAGGLAFIVGVGAFLLLRGGGGKSDGGGSPNLSAYLQAETQQNAQDNAFAAAKAGYDAQTAQAGIIANQNISVANTWATAGLATTEANNAASQQKGVLDWFGQLANNLGTVLSSSSSSSKGSGGGLNIGLPGVGSFGFNSNSSGSNSSSSQTLVANSQQSAAEHELELIASSLFHPAH